MVYLKLVSRTQVTPDGLVPNENWKKFEKLERITNITVETLSIFDSEFLQITIHFIVNCQNL